MVFSYTLPLAEEHKHSLLVPASLSTVWTGFLMLTTRRKAIMQVLGYLLLENGIFLFGLLLLEAMPFLVEAGVLLDLFTGVFVMGIIIHHISREFTSISTEYLIGVEGITDDLLADRVSPGDGGGDLRPAFRPAAGPGSCPWGRLGHLALVLSAVFRPGDAPVPSRGWEAGCCSIRWGSSSSAS